MNKENNNEIDLLEVLSRAYKFFKKYFFIILGVTILGAILGLFKNKINQDYYITSVAYKSTVVNGGTIIEMINRVIPIFEEKNYDFLKEKLQLTKEQVDMVKGLEAEEYNETKVGNSYQLKIQYFDKEVIDPLLQGIENFIMSNKFIISQYELEKEYIDLLVERINKEIEELDSFQNTYLSSLVTNRNSQIVNLNSHNEMMSLYEKKKGLVEKQKMIEKPLVLIYDYILPGQPEELSTFRIIFIWGFLFFLISNISLLVFELIKIIKNR